MPIVYPPSFDCMSLVPFNINPHYLDPNPQIKHNGETRETRIKEFLTQNDIKVVGLRKGNWIRRIGYKITTKEQSSPIFQKEKNLMNWRVGVSCRVGSWRVVEWRENLE